MKNRPSRNTPQIIKDLRKEIPAERFDNMLILGLNVPLYMIKSQNDMQRVIVFLNKSIINSREEMDTFMKEVTRLNTKNVQLKAHIMSKMKEYKEFDPEVFKFLDD